MAMPDPGGKINVMRVAGAWSQAISGYKRHIGNWCSAALAGKRAGTVSVVLADDKFVQDLNYQYRGKNKPTNVLSFCGEGDELGDIVLAFETIRREAKEQGKSFSAHTSHLVIHGVLHLLGFDHENSKHARKMEKKEIAILAGFGFKNPYEVK
jgi:probable rRNA maturation factor